MKQEFAVTPFMERSIAAFRSPVAARCFTWSPEAIETLTRCVADGWSAGQTAAKLGCTRNAAMGFANRRGLKFGGGVPTLPAINKRGAITVASATKATGEPRQRKTTHTHKVAKPPPERFRPPIEPPPCGGVALDDIGPHQCRYAINRWPLGMSERARFCGADAEGSYCPEHHRVCYTPRAKASGRPWVMDRAA